MAGVPLHRVPATGAVVPGIGLGTFGSDSVDASAVAQAVDFALEAGYRHIDCASVYGNEKQIGYVLHDRLKGGSLQRDHVWITSKLWNDMHAESDVVEALRSSLSDLGLSYLDLYLIHWPFPNYHPPGCDVSSRSPDARPYLHEEFMRTWRILEDLVDANLIRHIGTSNMTEAKLSLVIRDARIKPSFNEMELHPHFQQTRFVEYVKRQGIIPIGYSPLGSPGRPERDKTQDDSVDMEDPVVVAVARRHGVHPAAVCLKWAVANGHIPIPFSVNPRNIEANLHAVSEDPLSPDEKRMLDGIDRNCRLIKGQVFLWPGAESWHDLWDEDGRIPGWPKDRSECV